MVKSSGPFGGMEGAADNRQYESDRAAENRPNKEGENKCPPVERNLRPQQGEQATERVTSAHAGQTLTASHAWWSSDSMVAADMKTTGLATKSLFSPAKEKAMRKRLAGMGVVLSPDPERRAESAAMRSRMASGIPPGKQRAVRNCRRLRACGGAGFAASSELRPSLCGHHFLACCNASAMRW